MGSLSTPAVAEAELPTLAADSLVRSVALLPDAFSFPNWVSRCWGLDSPGFLSLPTLSPRSPGGGWGGWTPAHLPPTYRAGCCVPRAPLLFFRGVLHTRLHHRPELSPGHQVLRPEPLWPVLHGPLHR